MRQLIRPLFQAGLAMFTPPSVKMSSFLKDLPPLKPSERRLYLLRHGETDWNARGLMQGGGFDIELNENGRQQAIRVAQELEGLAAGIVASSHLQRAKQTADILHQNNCPSAKRIILKEFGEMRFGELEGLALRGPEATSATREKFRSWNEKMRLDSQLEWPGGGESTAHVAKRGRSGIDMLLDQYPEEQHIVVVAHGRFNKILLATLLYGDECRHDLVKQGNACVNIIDLNIEGRHTWTARVINHVEHINGDLTPSPNALS